MFRGAVVLQEQIKIRDKRDNNERFIKKVMRKLI
jgi:hypothetical protein